MRKPRALAGAVFGLTMAAGAAALPVDVAVRNALSLADAGHLVFAFELAARNGGAVPLLVRAVDYTVAIEGVRLFSGSAQGFSLEPGAEKVVPLAGFSDGANEREILLRLQGRPRFEYRVTGVLHARDPAGAPTDLSFTASSHATTPEDPTPPERDPNKGPGRYSLLNY